MYISLRMPIDLRAKCLVSPRAERAVPRMIPVTCQPAPPVGLGSTYARLCSIPLSFSLSPSLASSLFTHTHHVHTVWAQTPPTRASWCAGTWQTLWRWRLTRTRGRSHTAVR